MSRALVASLALHLCILLCLLLLWREAPDLPDAVDQSVSVEIVPSLPSPDKAAEAPPVREPPKAANPQPERTSAAPQPAAAPAEPSKPAPPAEPAEDEIIAAKRFYAAAILDAPRSRGAKAALRTLESSEKMVQICNLEAMAQIEHWSKTYRPDFVVAYTFEDPKVSENALEAMGAAFRSHHRWYRLHYTCRMMTGRDVVENFSFAVGDTIPTEEWAQYNLTDDNGSE